VVEAAPPGPKDLPSNDERVSVVTQLLPQDHPLRHLFCGVVQHVFFVDMGMCDPQIVDYLAELLSRLLHGDDFYPFTDASGRRLQNLAEMATDTYLGPTDSGSSTSTSGTSRCSGPACTRKGSVGCRPWGPPIASPHISTRASAHTPSLPT